MNGLTLTVHRATNQIGGNCIELATGEGRVLLDVGRPLDAPKEATGLLPQTLNLDRPVDGVLISHPHQDHYGLLEELPASWPVYSGVSAGKLMHLTASIFGTAPVRNYRHWSGGNPSKWVVMIRPSLIRDFASKGVAPNEADAWSYSQWRGYLEQPDGVALKAWFDEGGARSVHLHTSGHASTADLKAFATAISPKALVPIHGMAWDTDRDGFENVVRLTDGEPLAII
ncbi:MBL fold metallo-hydrolase [uncultured Brevundimonas sp.]|uniref:MBL fold metallo-hydrolase n=1 Tax=uncultured Brevundimonas sp. TaxID=213418 RepID=UPI002622577F|nr:MBL fold metallo-hydrolase [uncultured Brevundimonas sp.]